MPPLYTLTQSSAVEKWKIVLHENYFVFSDLSVLSKKSNVAYTAIEGIFRNPESLYIVTKDRTFALKNQSGTMKFDGFLEYLLERTKTAAT
ncbi:MAG: hypothetical protein ACYTAF_17015 [Planctomycetota bacterium]|jgi:hypothetical protein